MVLELKQTKALGDSEHQQLLRADQEMSHHQIIPGSSRIPYVPVPYMLRTAYGSRATVYPDRYNAL